MSACEASMSFIILQIFRCVFVVWQKCLIRKKRGDPEESSAKPPKGLPASTRPCTSREMI